MALTAEQMALGAGKVASKGAEVVGDAAEAVVAKLRPGAAKSATGVVAATVKLDQAIVDKILSEGKGARPDPATYLSPDYITSHLSQFDGGVTKFSAATPSGVVGPPEGTFVMPKSLADNLVKQAGGSADELERLLSLDPGTLGANPVRIDVRSPTGVRMPSGNELGANGQWIPGGYTGGGIAEATIDPARPGTYITKPVFKGRH